MQHFTSLIHFLKNLKQSAKKLHLIFSWEKIWTIVLQEIFQSRQRICVYLRFDSDAVRLLEVQFKPTFPIVAGPS